MLCASCVLPRGASPASPWPSRLADVTEAAPVLRLNFTAAPGACGKWWLTASLQGNPDPRPRVQHGNARLEDEAMHRSPGDPFHGVSMTRPGRAPARRPIRRGQTDAALLVLGFSALLLLAWMLVAVGGDPHRLSTAENSHQPNKGTPGRVPSPAPNSAIKP